MVWVNFKDPFNFTPAADRRITVSYKAGRDYNVTRECVAKAESVGARFVLLKRDSENGDFSAHERDTAAEGAGDQASEDGSSSDDGSGESEREGA